MKWCSRCEKDKVYSEFNKNKNSKDGLNSICKECNKRYMKRYNKDHSERLKPVFRQHYKDNVERYITNQKNWQSKSPAGVYLLTTREGRYIGQTGCVAKRVIEHKNSKESKCFGKEVLSVEVLEVVSDKKERLQREQYWIDKLKPELNIQ